MANSRRVFVKPEQPALVSSSFPLLAAPASSSLGAPSAVPPSPLEEGVLLDPLEEGVLLDPARGSAPGSSRLLLHSGAG